jgi:uncharacterized protein YndB with AHSA1/START domain
MTDPLRMSFDVACSVEHAFDVWTNRIDTWWPADHSVSGEPEITVFLQGVVGGRIYERTADGTEHEWGRVTEWTPPTRLAYVWHLRRDPSEATEVGITFVPHGPDVTRVEIEHRGWEQLADGSQWRERNVAGWQSLLPHFVRASNKEE